MIEGCAINGDFIHCMLRYHPWYVGLFVLSVIGIGIVIHVWKT